MNIPFIKLRDIAEEAGIDTDNNIRTNYSGRGMYGKECVGFDLDSKSDLLDLGAALQTEGVLEEFTSRASFDSMGMGLIVYFPGITCDDAPVDPNDDVEEFDDEDEE